MRNLYRGLTSIALLIMMFFAGIGSAFAVPDMPPSVIPVVDDTKSLTAEELMMIGKAANIDDSDVKVYTYIAAEIPVEHSGNIETATNEVFTAWNLENRSGVLIYIAEADGEINIQLSESLTESLTAEDMERILSESIIPSLREDNYTQGIASGIRDIKNTVDENSSITIIPAGFTESAGFTAIKSVLIGIVPTTILVLLLSFVLRLKKAASTKIGEASQTLNNTVSDAKKAYSKTEKTLQNSSFSSSHSSKKVDRYKLKNDLKKLYEEDSTAFFSMFEGISGINETMASTIKDDVNSFTSSSNSLYDGNKLLDDLAASSSSSSSYSSYSSPYSSSYNSSYGSDYKTSYSSDFGTNSDLSSDDD